MCSHAQRDKVKGQISSAPYTCCGLQELILVLPALNTPLTLTPSSADLLTKPGIQTTGRRAAQSRMTCYGRTPPWTMPGMNRPCPTSFSWSSQATDDSGNMTWTMLVTSGSSMWLPPVSVQSSASWCVCVLMGPSVCWSWSICW